MSLRAEARRGSVVVGALSLGAAAIHFAVVHEHFDEFWLFGIFFALLAWYQSIWALLYVLAPTRPLAVTAVVVNAATVLLWAWAHLIGLPIGPNPGELEATGAIDVMATLLEAVLVVVLVIRLVGPEIPPPGRGPIPLLWTWLLVAAIVAVTTYALAAPAPGDAGATMDMNMDMGPEATATP